MDLNHFVNLIARETFGMSLVDAHDRQICLHCKKSVKEMNLASLDLNEYNQSGLCPHCLDEILTAYFHYKES